MVKRVEDHPEADRIRLAQVDLGDGAGPVQIVFGGPPVVRVDSLVAVAPPGATVRVGPRTTRMRRRNYRGMSSHGMLCSLNELGWAIGARDEVALLKDVRPGDALDGLSLRRRLSIMESPRPSTEFRLVCSLSGLCCVLTTPLDPGGNACCVNAAQAAYVGAAGGIVVVDTVRSSRASRPVAARMS